MEPGELETQGFPLPDHGALCRRSGVCSTPEEAGGRDGFLARSGRAVLLLSHRCSSLLPPGTRLRSLSPKNLGTGASDD